MAPFKDRDEYERWKAARVAGGPEPAPARDAETRPARADPRLIRVGAFNAALLPLIFALIGVLSAPFGGFVLTFWAVLLALIMGPGGAFLGLMVGRSQPSWQRLLLLSFYASLFPVLLTGIFYGAFQTGSVKSVQEWLLRVGRFTAISMALFLPIYVIVAFDLRQRARTRSPA